MKMHAANAAAASELDSRAGCTAHAWRELAARLIAWRELAARLIFLNLIPAYLLYVYLNRVLSCANTIIFSKHDSKFVNSISHHALIIKN